jgi:hypothetical protein
MGRGRRFGEQGRRYEEVIHQKAFPVGENSPKLLFLVNKANLTQALLVSTV